MDEQLEFMKEIARRLDSAHIRYMLTGSVAMAVYTVPRMTRDIDLVIECRPKDAPRIAAPEDLILSKLKWAKDSGSSLQERDVKLLLETVERLDHDYIRRWAEWLGVEELLKRLEERCRTPPRRLKLCFAP